MIESVLSSLFTLENLLWINVGLAGGIMVGALPGLTGTMAIALLLPLTYGLASIPAVMLLLAPGDYRLAVFLGYFRHPLIFLANFLPIALLMLLGLAVTAGIIVLRQFT